MRNDYFKAVTLMALLAFITLMPSALGQDRPTPTPATIEQNADGTAALLAFDAKIDGTRAKIEKKGDAPHNIGFWTDARDKALWNLRVVRPGRYDVEVEYSLDPRAKGSEYAIEFGDQKIHVKPEITKSWTDFTKTKVGTIEFKERSVVPVVVRPLKKPGQAVLDLRGIKLTPARP